MQVMDGWLWIIAALLIAMVELLLPAWIFLGTAIAVLIMGLILLAGIWLPDLPLALVVTGLLSGVVWLVLRRAMGVSHGQVKIWRSDINDNDSHRPD